MFDEIIIGSGPNRNSAYHLLDLPSSGHVSENDVAFWCSSVYLGFSMKVYRDTEEGRAIQEVLDSGVTPEAKGQYIEQLLTLAIIKHADPKLLIRRIGRAIFEAQERGSHLRAKEIRLALGIAF